MEIKKLLSCSLLTGALIACGDNDMSTTADFTSVEGLWIGEHYIENGEGLIEQYFTIALFDDDIGYVHAPKKNSIIVTTSFNQLSDQAFEIIGTEYTYINPENAVKLAGTNVGEKIIYEHHASDDSLVGTTELSNFSSYSQLEDLAGVYNERFAQATIDKSGKITFSHINGCYFEGDIQTREDSYALYNVSVEISNCQEKDGQYDGLLAYTDKANELNYFQGKTDAIFWVLTGSETSYIHVMTLAKD